MGFAVNTHFCCGITVDSSITMGVEQLDCGMMHEKESTSDQEEVDKESCCKNVHQVLEIDNNRDTPLPSFDLNKTFLVAFAHTFILNPSITQRSTTDYFSYTPPPRLQDVQVLYQSFLI